MRIFVIGAGAMGCTYGGLLQRAGHDVKLVDVLPEHLEAIRRDGLHLDGISGYLRLAIPAVSEPDERAAADVAFIHVNAYDTAAAARTAKQMLKDTGYAVTFQNGVGNIEILQETLTNIARQPSSTHFLAAAKPIPAPAAAVISTDFPASSSWPST